MKNGIFAFDWGTVADMVVTAIAFAVATALYQVATTTGFDVFTANWSMIGESMVNIGFIAGVVSFVQNFISTNSGSILGITPNTTSTPTL